MKIKRFIGLSELCRWLTSRYQVVLLGFFLATMFISTLEKFLASESDKNSSKSHKITVGRGQLGDTIRNKENVISHKSAIKDPSFVKKIGQLEELEDRRQKLYLDILKKRGQIVMAPDGAQIIVSYPKVVRKT